jgi:plastocyanin
MRIRVFGAAVFALAAAATSARAYEAVEVKDGGTISGRVKVVGAAPKDDVIQVTKDQSHCGQTLPREKYVIGKDGGVQNAVVILLDIARGKAAAKDEVPIVNKICAFHPHVQVATKGQDMVVVNEDPMLHNTHMYLDKRTIFNAALPRTGMKIKKPIQKTGIVDVQCDEHDWMRGYLYVADHPYLAATDADGAFSIGDVPPGTYKVRLWHETFGTQEKSVTVAPGAKVTLDFDLK